MIFSKTGPRSLSNYPKEASLKNIPIIIYQKSEGKIPLKAKQ